MIIDLSYFSKIMTENGIIKLNINYIEIRSVVQRYIICVLYTGRIEYQKTLLIIKILLISVRR